MSAVVLLGPQRPAPVLADALGLLDVEGPLVTITAGWEEREGELEGVEAHLGRPLEDLGIYRRSEEVLLEDDAFLEVYRERRARLRSLQRLYRIRLGHLLAADHDLRQRASTNALAVEERVSVMGQIRALDRHHQRRLRETHRWFQTAVGPTPALRRHRREVQALVQDAAAVLVAGGHLGILLNRLHLFGLVGRLRRRPVIAWSAGAMAVCRTAFLFYDDPPHGEGHPEMFSPGLGLVTGLVVLPDAARRLRLHDAERVGRLARRTAPKTCAALDDGCGLLARGRTFHPVLGGARRLEGDGRVVEWPAH